MEPFVPMWHKATTTAECRLQNRMESLWRRQGAAFLRARYFSLELIQMFTGFIWEIIQPPQSLNQSHKTPQGRKGTETLKWPYLHGKLQNLLGKAPQHLCLEKSTTLTLTHSVFSAETSSIKDCTTPLPVIMKMYFLIHIQKKRGSIQVMASRLAERRVRWASVHQEKSCSCFHFDKTCFSIISPEIKHLRDTAPVLFLTLLCG